MSNLVLTRRFRRWLVQAVVAGPVLCATRAHAQPAETETIRLDYAASAPRCPTRAAFAASVTARTSKAALVSSGDTVRRFSIKIRRKGRQVVGALEVRTPSELEGKRRFVGADCAEVASALAFAAALAIDPTAPLFPPEKTQPAKTQGVKAPARPPAPREPQDPPTGSTLGAGLGASVAVVFGPAPDALFAGGISLRLGLDTAPGQPSLYVHALAARTGVVSRSNDAARYDWLAARIQLCPLRAFVTKSLWFDPCASTDVGVLHGVGRSAAETSESTRPWVSAGPSIGLGLRANDSLSLHLSALLAANLVRDEFVFESPERTIHHVPPATLSVLFGGMFALL